MSDDAMVPIADILSRSEALTVAAMLDAAGIIVHVGGEYHASISPYVIAIGGFRLTVPHWQHGDASKIVADMRAAPESTPSPGLRRAILRLFAASMSGFALVAFPYVLTMGLQAVAPFLLSPLFMLGVPVNPQGRGDYYIADAPA